jgi:hypothetical protein
VTTRKKIASALGVLLDIKPGRTPGTTHSVTFNVGTRTCYLAQKELRALLAVSREARRVHAELGAFGYAHSEESLGRALDRLDRSRAPTRGEGR